MTSQHPSHAESSHSSDKPPPGAGPKLHVQGPLSKENITVHFSLGKKEEEEEDELYCTSDSSASAALGDSNIVTAVEAIEEMFDPAAEVPVIPDSSRFSPSSSNHTNRSPTQALSSHAPEQKPSTITSSAIKSLSFPSSLVKSLSSDVDARDGVTTAPALSVRQRPLMKNLVKSLSSDTSQDSSSSSTTQRLLDSRLNLQLFKQFAQSRMASASVTSVSDSKTAPSTPLPSPDKPSLFKVLEVEARIEDTKRRLSEAIAEPLQLLSKIMDEKGGGLVGGSIYRPKGLSASATELSTLSSVNGSLENNNNNNCIKEEEGPELEVESPNSWTSVSAESLSDPPANTKSPSKSSLLSMSALAKQEEEDFCILTSEDFETCTDTEGDGANGLSRTGSQVALSGSSDPSCDDECEDSEPAPDVPFYTLMVLTSLVYACFVLPLPSYVRGMLLGLAFGFYLAIGVVWLAGPKRSGREVGFSRNKGKLENAARVDIKEPDIYKGWMNEIQNYDPETYHATLTQSVYVRLDGSTIRLSKPNHNIARRASHKEPKPDVTFIGQKMYDLTNCKVYLAPQNLAKKRVWNKKYPICIQLSKQDDFMSKAEGDQVESSESTGSRDDGERTSGGMERPSSSSTHLTLFLFGRTGREKEDWFQRFLLASHVRVESKKASSVGGSKKAAASKSHSRNSSRSSLNEMLSSQPKSKDSAAGSTKSMVQLDFNVYMSSFLPKQQSASTAASSSASSLQSSPGADKKLQSSASAQVQPRGEEDESVAWVNAAVARLLWDFLTKPCWAEMVSKKIQMKLSKIRLPYFMNELTLTELDMGSAFPRILGASTPSMDYRGLWFDLEFSYCGSFLMTLETKMILNRLGKEGESLRVGDIGRDGVRPRTYCLAASDEESSSAGSSDEEDSSDLSNDSAGAESLVGGHKPSKIMRFVDKIAKSKYFQKATETEFIKKKMEEVSNTPLLLTVEVQELRGTLAVNIPPPPTDRIWYGFRTPPHLELKARPKLGEREVTLAHVTDWIERKLEQEFMKILVMPNMDDVWLGIMHPATITHPADGPSPPHTHSTEPSWQETDGPP